MVPQGLLDQERKRLEKELEQRIGEIERIVKKLGNERFVQNAPSKVVEMEKKKQKDAEAKIDTLMKSIENLKKGAL